MECECCTIETPKHVIIKRHGTFNEMMAAIWRACHDLFITPDEARKAIQKYKKALADAPCQ